MTRPPIAASATVRADAARVWAILADYHEGHPRILPRPPFTGLEVERGGIGAGTIIRYGLRVPGGGTRAARAEVAEPEPGRVLSETDLANGTVTTFTVEPAGAECRVTIATALPERRGILGWIEHVLAARFLHGVYQRELRLLAQAAEREAAPAR
jgi:hypothetical protein